MITKFRTYAAMVRLGTFTVEELAKATGLVPATIATQLNRLPSDSLESTPQPAGRRGGQPRRHRLTEIGQAWIRSQLRGALGDVEDSTAWYRDPERAQRGLTELPAELLAAEYELLRDPHRPGKDRRLARAQGLLDLAQEEMDAAGDPVSAGARRRLQAARTVAALVTNEVAVERRQGAVPTQSVLSAARALVAETPGDAELDDLRRRVAASPLLRDETPQPALQVGIVEVGEGSASAHFARGVFASEGFYSKIFTIRDRGEVESKLKDVLAAMRSKDSVLVFDVRLHRGAWGLKQALDIVPSNMPVILMGDEHNIELKELSDQSEIEFVNFGRTMGNVSAAYSLKQAINHVSYQGSFRRRVDTPRLESPQQLFSLADEPNNAPARKDEAGTQPAAEASDTLNGGSTRDTDDLSLKHELRPAREPERVISKLQKGGPSSGMRTFETPRVPSVKYGPGVPMWVDLGTSDLEAANRFYSALFGWEFQSAGADAGGYGFYRKNGKMVAGAGPLVSEQQPATWSTYIDVANADETITKAREKGGTVIVEPMDVMEAGRMAFFLDPTGAAIGVWQPLQLTGAQLANEPGAFAWNELATRDIEAAKKFYKAVFNWDGTTNPRGATSYTEFTIGDRTVAGMREMGSMDPPQVPPHWLVYFAVEDTDSAVATASRSGAQVLVPPMTLDPGRLSVLTDPQGAAFAIIALNPAAVGS
jgi:predicted enzyme related to lactoylglutathione lyase